MAKAGALRLNSAALGPSTQEQFLPSHQRWPHRIPNRILEMTKVQAVQKVILQLIPNEQEQLRIWLDEKAFDLEADSSELEAVLLTDVPEPPSTLSKADLEAVAERVLGKNPSCRSA